METLQLTPTNKCFLNCEGDLRLYAFPKIGDQEGKREQWLRLFGIQPDATLPNMMYACERHFSAKMRCTRNRMRNAVPNMNLPVLTSDSELPIAHEAFNISKCAKPLQEPEVVVNVNAIREQPLASLDPIGTIIEIADTLCGEHTPHEGLDAFNNMEVQTYETVAEYITKNRRLKKRLDYCKYALKQKKQELKEIKQQRKLLLERCQMDKKSPVHVLPKRSWRGKGCPQNRVCGNIEVTKDKSYNINCFYCSELYSIWSWAQFVSHIKEKHHDLEETFMNENALNCTKKRPNKNSVKLEQIEEMANEVNDNNTNRTEEPCLEPTHIKEEIFDEIKVTNEAIEEILAMVHKKTGSNSTEEAAHNCTNDVSDNDVSPTEEIYLEHSHIKVEIFDDIVLENESVLSNCKVVKEVIGENEEETTKALQTEEGADEKAATDIEDFTCNSDNISDEFISDGEQSTGDGIKRKTCNKMSITKTDPRIMLAFLDLLKKYPILWHPRLKSAEAFDSAIAEVTDIVNAKWGRKMSKLEMRQSLNLIKNWYRRAVEFNKEDKAKGVMSNSKKRLYFNKCLELEENSNRIVISCDMCESRFLHESQLQMHKCVVHNVGELPYKCKHCNLRVSHRWKLRVHEQRKHNRQRSTMFVCGVCRKEFCLVKYYIRHMDKHNADEEQKDRYSCEKCGKKFPTIGQHRDHLLYHDNPNHTCEICSKQFYRSFTLRQHMKAHQDQRDFVCEKCGKAFVRKASLNIHKVTHLDKKPFTCTICGAFFTQYSNLFRHQKTAHLVLEGKVEDLKMSAYYRNHIKVIGPKVRRFTCKTCEIEFKSLKCLRAHRKFLHKTQNLK